MTWADIKRAIEAAGVKDDDEVWCVDLPAGAPVRNVRLDDELGWFIQ